MHPPPFHPSHRLSDWPGCYLEARCGRCDRATIASIRLLWERHGDVRLLDLIPRLRCDACKVGAAPVYLCASPHRSFVGGPSADWSLELVPPKGPASSS